MWAERAKGLQCGFPLYGINGSKWIELFVRSVSIMQEDPTLDPVQQRVVLSIASRKNTAVLGPAGSGKSFCVKQALSTSSSGSTAPRKYVICPTGMTASSWEDGVTLHAWLGFVGPKDIGDDTTVLAKRAVAHLKKIGANDTYKVHKPVFVLEEISMWSTYSLHLFDRVMRMLMGKQKIFGGMQVVCLGDHAQLPPVIKGVKDAYEYSALYSELMSSFQVFQLEVPHRQLSTVGSGEEDDEDGRRCTADLLKGMRAYNWTVDAYGMVTHRKQHPNLTKGLSVFEALKIDHDMPILAYHNKTVDSVNQEVLSRIPGSLIYIVPYVKNATPEQLDSWTISVKEGCTVIFTRTIRSMGKSSTFCAVNGTRGILNYISGPTRLSPDDKTFAYITVDGYDAPFKFPMSITKSGPLAKVQEVREVMPPFRNGPAMTIHKSQGQTFGKGILFTEGLREVSLLYVALSRFMNIMDATLVGPCIHPCEIVVPEGRRKLDDRVQHLVQMKQ